MSQPSEKGARTMAGEVTCYKLVSGATDDGAYVVFDDESAAYMGRSDLMEMGYPDARVDSVVMTRQEYEQLCAECPVDDVSDVW